MVNFDKLVAGKHIVNLDWFTNEREIRRKISELRKEGIIYIPLYPKQYHHIDTCTITEIETFAKAQLSHMKKQYFNTLRPLKNHLSDLKLQTMIEQLNLFEEEK